RQPRERDAGSALDVVVVTQDLFFVSVEQPDRIGPLPIFEVYAAAWKGLLRRLNELINEFVQLRLGRGLLTQTEIERIGAERVIGRADVEQYRQQAVGRHGPASGIKLSLAEGNPQAVRADVAETENAPARRDANEADVPLRPVAHYFSDASLHLARDVHAARAPVDVAECEASLGDRGVINNRHKARRIGHERA